MDETERKHCLLDLHAIRESICPEQRSVDFVKKWGAGLESILAEVPEADRDDMVEASDLRESQERSIALERAGDDVVSKVRRAMVAVESAMSEWEVIAG